MLPVVLLIIGIVLWLLAARTRRGAGLPAGRVVYADTGAWARPEKALFSKTLGLTGKPDYLVQHKGRYIPVEVKSGQGAAVVGGDLDAMTGDADKSHESLVARLDGGLDRAAWTERGVPLAGIGEVVELP